MRAGCRKAGQPALVPALVPGGRFGVGLVAADTGVDEYAVVARAHEVGNDRHDQATGRRAQGFRYQPLPVGFDRLGRRLIEHVRRQVDGYLVLDDSVNGDITQLHDGH